MPPWAGAGRWSRDIPGMKSPTFRRWRSPSGGPAGWQRQGRPPPERWQMMRMARGNPGLLAEIERDALNDTVPLATTLRKCVALGGQARSGELRNSSTEQNSPSARDRPADPVSAQILRPKAAKPQVKLLHLPRSRKHEPSQVSRTHGGHSGVSARGGLRLGAGGRLPWGLTLVGVARVTGDGWAGCPGERDTCRARAVHSSCSRPYRDTLASTDALQL
jgi:hypothetical protein